MKKFWPGVASAYKCIMAMVNEVSARFLYAMGEGMVTTPYRREGVPKSSQMPLEMGFNSVWKGSIDIGHI